MGSDPLIADGEALSRLTSEKGSDPISELMIADGEALSRLTSEKGSDPISELKR